MEISDAGDDLPPIEIPRKQAGFIHFYGLYWRKGAVDWPKKQLLGQPRGWAGKGRHPVSGGRSALQMNFWNQKGVYILYDSNLQPVYAGQAGLTRRDNPRGGNGSVGERLAGHQRGVYRNGWHLFSWFGFLATERLNMKNTSPDQRLNPDWKPFSLPQNEDLNLTLASFEAILIEGFSPRFNARGGDLRGAYLVNQYES